MITFESHHRFATQLLAQPWFVALLDNKMPPDFGVTMAPQDVLQHVLPHSTQPLLCKRAVWEDQKEYGPIELRFDTTYWALRHWVGDVDPRTMLSGVLFSISHVLWRTITLPSPEELPFDTNDPWLRFTGPFVIDVSPNTQRTDGEPTDVV